MRANKIPSSWIPLCMIVFIIVAPAAYGKSAGHEGHHEDDHHGHGQAKHDHAASPLLDEMIALDEVFREVVSAVAVSAGGRVHTALEKMHGTMEKTHEGVRHGTVTLKKNADRMKEFVEMDKQFHAKLEDLALAGRKNDGNAMLSLTKQLLDGCVKCHRDFRVQ